ncbi:hypothetical protein LAZ67_16002691 [Cordylochernes scorpioides]|uniref:TIL domain-containing protein n=1 Tax=Cordylochernes scorpioides TaxID=51811 RepID=A0ABY6LDH5_9ARAC|nr:hypothetical protein LAZ67_16002691 [Cordylochernes scorpioides]
MFDEFKNRPIREFPEAEVVKRLRQCTKPNEEFSPCGPACQINCTTYNNPPFCIQMCVPGCFCNPGYIRETDDSSDCIRPWECK